MTTNRNVIGSVIPLSVCRTDSTDKSFKCAGSHKPDKWWLIGSQKLTGWNIFGELLLNFSRYTRYISKPTEIRSVCSNFTAKMVTRYRERWRCNTTPTHVVRQNYFVNANSCLVTRICFFFFFFLKFRDKKCCSFLLFH